MRGFVGGSRLQRPASPASPICQRLRARQLRTAGVPRYPWQLLRVDVSHSRAIELRFVHFDLFGIFGLAQRRIAGLQLCLRFLQ